MWSKPKLKSSDLFIYFVPFICFAFWTQSIWVSIYLFYFLSPIHLSIRWSKLKNWRRRRKIFIQLFWNNFFSNLFQKQKKVKILRLSECFFSSSNNVFLQICIFWSEHDPVALIKSWCFWWCSSEQFVKQITQKVKFAKC